MADQDIPRCAGCSDRVDDVLFGRGALMDRNTQQGHGLGVLLVSRRRFVVLEASGELVGVLEDLVDSSRHLASLKE